MYLKSVLQMASLMVHFRNGRTLVERMRAGEPCEEVVLRDGLRISHPPGRGGLLEAVIELWIEKVYTAGFYRPASGDVIIDAGANIGLFAIQMARQNPRCRIFALEPFPENFDYLQANVARGSLRNVTCWQMALGAKFTTGEMKAVGSRSLDHVLCAESSAGNGIPVIPLTGLFDLAGAQEIDFFKVDIEGSEHDAFAHVSPEIVSRFKRIAIEYHDQIVPGTLAVLQSVLDSTHNIVVHPSTLEGNGILLARSRSLKN
jgi:FkbM family methyltransferase